MLISKYETNPNTEIRIKVGEENPHSEPSPKALEKGDGVLPKIISTFSGGGISRADEKKTLTSSRYNRDSSEWGDFIFLLRACFELRISNFGFTRRSR